MDPREPSILNQVQLHRPPCPKCGRVTSLARIEPCDEPDHDLRTFECDACGHAAVLKIKFR
jgi:predicted RNA-binding Zn-ribbon protein involved in translation (DUF1610 family)